MQAAIQRIEAQSSRQGASVANVAGGKCHRNPAARVSRCGQRRWPMLPATRTAARVFNVLRVILVSIFRLPQPVANLLIWWLNPAGILRSAVVHSLPA